MAIVKTPVFQPALTACALFAGFSFTAVLSLVLSGKSGVTTALMIIAFIISAAAFILSTIAMAMLLEGIASKQNFKNHTDFFVNFGVGSIIVGFTAFSIGLAASGFLYSICLGVVSVVCAGSVVISVSCLTARLSSID
jgi:hypothetical protein